MEDDDVLDKCHSFNFESMLWQETGAVPQRAFAGFAQSEDWGLVVAGTY